MENKYMNFYFNMLFDDINNEIMKDVHTHNIMNTIYKEIISSDNVWADLITEINQSFKENIKTINGKK